MRQLPCYNHHTVLSYEQSAHHTYHVRHLFIDQPQSLIEIVFNGLDFIKTVALEYLISHEHLQHLIISCRRQESDRAALLTNNYCKLRQYMIFNIHLLLFLIFPSSWAMHICLPSNLLLSLGPDRSFLSSLN